MMAMRQNAGKKKTKQKNHLNLSAQLCGQSHSQWLVPGCHTRPPSWPAAGWCPPAAPGCCLCASSAAQTSPAPSELRECAAISEEEHPG